MSAQATVRLVMEEIRDGSIRLARVPRWAQPSDGEGYWHIPRSGELVDPALTWRGKHKGDDLIVAQFWCGQTRWLKRDSLMARPFTGALLCGTCEGRARGYERRDGLIFAPRSPFDPPKFCPAFLTTGEKQCPFCGAKPTYRRSYCHYDQAQHRPKDGLQRATPCPRHGWKYARRQSSGLICLGSHFGAMTPRCGFELMLEATA